MTKGRSETASHLLCFAYFRLIIDARGQAKDYQILDISPDFETLTGWRRAEVLRKKASEIPARTESGGFHWLSYYETVVRSGKPQETIRWIKPLNRHLIVTVIPSDRASFMLLVRDTAGEAAQAGRYEEAHPLPQELEAFFNSTHDAISLVEYRNGVFRFIRNNALHQELTGYSRIGGFSPVELLGPEVGGRLEAYYTECLRTGRPVRYEQNFDFAPGKRVWQTEVTLLSGEGDARYLLCSSKDVSELKRVQCEHDLLTQRLKAMFYRHSAVMLMVEPVSGRIVDANPAACAFYGYDREEMQSLLIHDINTLPVAEVEAYRLKFFEGAQRKFTFPHRRKDGSVRVVDVYSCLISDGDGMLLYSIIFDVTDRETYREELFQEKEMLLTTLRSIGDGVVTTDGTGLITSLNTVAQEITGWENGEAKGLAFSEVFRLQNEETGEPVENPIQTVLETGRIIGLANHTELINRRGECIPIADSAAPIRTEDGETVGVVMVFRDVSMEKEHSKEIEYLSYHDPLTGLYNRRYIEESLDRLDRPENLPISVIMGDVNGLKITNDVFGHKAGDGLLQSVAALLKKNCSGEGLAARWGGDEFIILMPRTSVKAAENMVERIKNDQVPIKGSALRLSLSLGCAGKDAAKKSIQAVLREAEENMYHQKLLDGKSYRNAIINTLLATLYEKSFETEEHSKRMEKYCHCIGRKLRLSSKEMNELSLLALLHDIGKVSIHPSILQKPGPLDEAEWDEMKRHSEIGYRIAQATPELAIVSELILSHHERWDGEGYPRRLKGEDIPLACRILAVTDAFDAMTNDRVYRSAIGAREAIKELRRHAGRQFDPLIVNLLEEEILREAENTIQYADRI